MSDLEQFHVIDGPSKARLSMVLFHPDELKSSTVEFQLDCFGSTAEYKEFTVEGVRRGSYLGKKFVISVCSLEENYMADIHFNTHSRKGTLIMTERPAFVDTHKQE